MGGEWKGRREGEEQEREERVRRVEWKGEKEGRGRVGLKLQIRVLVFHGLKN